MKLRKLFGIIIISVISIVSVSSCNNEESNVQTDENEVVSDDNEPQNLVTVNIAVEGMTCEGCEKAITNSIMALDGINHTKVSHVEGNAVVEFDSAKTSLNEIKEAIIGTGYKVVEN